MNVLLLAASAVIAYLLGSVNGAILASRVIYHRDVRDYGSHNAGLTNFYRTFGAPGAVLVCLIDIAKAVASVLVGGALLSIADAQTVGRLFAGFCLILGHMFPIFHQFRGGKGVLCGFVTAFLVDWRVGLLCGVVFLLLVIFTRYVSLGSMAAMLLCPVFLWMFGYTFLEGLLALLSGLLITVKHGENILRLIGGTERRLEWKGRSNRRK
ncbi:MAG: glycerol-3-phosphate 1-O-acyltransferase PlsY [Oscillospiraceae bacterium]|nr:glycerol-3-phosphate 1-O-acyltransferase PlsY [Oscillospiraceae bacterium]MCC8155858.1 glycerol-3-phosphate 1-O-acyltransferase PlsY [Oscillospiraceae bacterium]MCD7853969.1 glycerol-3-phosphate 1-O-acyltransferase PlsY [Oscillospiraceae bacterium]MCD8128017.1 glycerol-3-phosphate 1-O-acyltransferase PlsY [Oscillospiraceae bacterium]